MTNNNKFSNDLYIIFYHPTWSTVSDKTLRRFLKDISRLCHKAITEEIEYLIRELDLDDRHRQSIRDQLYKQIASGSFYYVENFKKGSTSVEIISSSWAIWLLVLVFAEAIKSVVKKKSWFKRIEDVLETEIKLKNYIFKRPEKLSEIYKGVLEQEGTLNRFQIDKIEYVKEARHELRITLKTDDAVDLEIVSVKYDTTKIMLELEKEINNIKDKINDVKKDN